MYKIHKSIRRHAELVSSFGRSITQRPSCCTVNELRHMTYSVLNNVRQNPICIKSKRPSAHHVVWFPILWALLVFRLHWSQLIASWLACLPPLMLGVSLPLFRFWPFLCPIVSCLGSRWLGLLLVLPSLALPSCSEVWSRSSIVAPFLGRAVRLKLSLTDLCHDLFYGLSSSLFHLTWDMSGTLNTVN